jgi:plasmid stabilization system protein ParE
MTYSLEIAAEAETDIRNAFLWYEDQQENLGSTFEQEIKKAIQSIERNPLKTQIRYRDIRVFFLDKFPYGIHFKLDDDLILILAVFHTSQNPGKWKRTKLL